MAERTDNRATVWLRGSQANQWQADKVAQFIHQLLTSAIRDIALRIWADAKEIEWGIRVFSKDRANVLSTLQAFYPETQPREVQAAPQEDTNEWFVLDYELANSFCNPLRYAQELKTIDPLASLVAVLSNLRDNERVLYELNVLPIGEDLNALGQKEYKKEYLPSTGSKIFEFSLGVLERAISGGKYYPPVPKSLEHMMLEQQYKERIQIVQEKLSLPLREIEMTIWIANASVERRKDLFYSFVNSLAFSRTEVQGITYKEDKTHRLILSPQEIAGLWHLPTEDMKDTPNILWAKKQVALTVDLPHGIKLGTNTYRGKTREVRLDYPDRVGHVNLIGKSGVGKSTLLHNMVHQDIANGKGVGVIDPHGDLVKDILTCSIPLDREQDVIIFDVSDTDYPVGLNLLSRPDNVGPETVASQALAIVRKMFAEQWSATQMEDALYAALIALVSVPNSTVMDIPRLFNDPHFRYQVLPKVTDPVALEYWQTEFEVMSTAKQQQTAKPINNRIRKFYRNPIMRRIICQADSLNFRQIMNNKKIFLANLGGLPAVEAETLGSILISKFQIAAMSRGNVPKEQRVPFYLTIDEVQNFVATPLDVIFSEARKYALSLTVANQFLSQLSGTILKAVLGNVGASIIMRTNPDDARVVSPFMGGRFDKEDLVTLDKFTAAVTMQLKGQSLPAFSLASLPPPEEMVNSDEIIKRLYDQSRKDYGQPKDEIDKAIASRFNSGEPPPPNEDQEQWSEEDDDDLYDDQLPEQND